MSSGRLPKRKGLDGHHVEAVVKVLTEAAGGHFPLQIAIGGSNDADVDGQAVVAADRHYDPFLHHAEQLGLEFQFQFADFVEEDRAAFGRTETAHCRRSSPR